MKNTAYNKNNLVNFLLAYLFEHGCRQCTQKLLLLLLLLLLLIVVIIIIIIIIIIIALFQTFVQVLCLSCNTKRRQLFSHLKQIDNSRNSYLNLSLVLESLPIRKMLFCSYESFFFILCPVYLQ